MGASVPRTHAWLGRIVWDSCLHWRVPFLPVGLAGCILCNVYYGVQAYGAEAPPQQMLWPDAVDQE